MEKQYIRKKMTLTRDEQKELLTGTPEWKLKTFATAQIFYMAMIRELEASGKVLDYSLLKGQPQTRIWLDRVNMNVKMQFYYEQVGLDMVAIGQEMIDAINEDYERRREEKRRRRGLA